MTTVGNDITLFDTSRRTYNFTPFHVFVTLGVGWAAFGLALIFNILYYVLHPSQVSLYYNSYFYNFIPGQREEFPRKGCCVCLWF